MSIKIAVLVSGRGSNLEAIINAVKGGLDAEIVVVASNNPDSYGLKIARKHGLETVAINHRGISRKDHDRLMAEAILPFAPDYVLLAGYMRILSAEFLNHFKGDGHFRVINIHPSLLPAFPGKSAYEDAFNYGVKVSGITIHLVDEQVDHGPILAQEVFPRLPGDSLDSFQARGLALEHKLYPRVLESIATRGLESLLLPRALKDPLCVMVTRSGNSGNHGNGMTAMPLYWICSDKEPQEMLADGSLTAALKEILADPLLEEVWFALPQDRHKWTAKFKDAWFCERQFLPGVTDNLARTVEEALRYSVGNFKVASGEAFLFDQKFATAAEVENYCRYRHFHPVTDRFRVHEIAASHGANDYLGFPEVHLPATPDVETISLALSDSELLALSKKRTLALTLSEMKAIRAYFEQEAVQNLRKLEGLPIWPTDVELEVIAQTWSEHCKHKIFNAAILDRVPALAGAKSAQAGERTIRSLYKSYIQAGTKKLAEQRQDLLSVFVDNAGVVKWTDDYAVCFKVETHNSPSALEPYGGALTGILGVNRDILGTGLGAKPIANTDIFCFAHPDSPDLVNRPTMLPARSIVQGVRKGVQDGGNKSGIPTVNGAVYFHNGYRAKPLVFCGTVGLLPLEAGGQCAYQKHTRVGDAIIMIGGRVGKDGIHGATFSSEALNVDSPVSAVQIGDPFTQKRVLDFILEARDLGLVSGLTDNGAGGLSSSVGEMAQITGGATLELDNIPLKYPGLADYEVVISESQERMTLSSTRIDELRKLAAKHTVELTVVGNFTESGYFKITRKGKAVALLDLNFLHDCPLLELEAQWVPSTSGENLGSDDCDARAMLLKLLAHPNIASRESVIRQYDHEVQGASVIKPLMGPTQKAPCDAAVIKPLAERQEGLAISNGLCPQLSEYDPYLMAQSAVDEAVRNAVCVGTDPATIAVLDNFCWPDPVVSSANPDGKRKLAQLVKACEGLYDACLAYGTPLISGKDSMKNDFDDGQVRLSIPPTLIVSAMGKVPNIDKVVTMEFKSPGDKIYVVAAGTPGLAGTVYLELNGWKTSGTGSIDINRAARNYSTIYAAICKGLVQSCHDSSDGGLMVAVAESMIGSGLGANLEISNNDPAQRMDTVLFGEGPATLVVTVRPEHEEAWLALWSEKPLKIGTVAVAEEGLKLKTANRQIEVSVNELIVAWQAALPFEEEV